MVFVDDLTLTQQLAREIKDPTTAEILTELVADWIKAQADKYVYFNDQDPCNCGADAGDSHRVEAAMKNLAEYISANAVVQNHRTGDCTERDDDDNDDDDEDED